MDSSGSGYVLPFMLLSDLGRILLCTGYFRDREEYFQMYFQFWSDTDLVKPSREPNYQRGLLQRKLGNHSQCN